MEEDPRFKEYYALQEKIASAVVHEDELPADILLIGGADVAYDDEAQEMVGAIVTLDAQSLQIVEQSVHRMKVSFPYVPGLFSFREIPALIEAFHQLNRKPQLLICDGHGIAHPRGAGMASHLGVELGVPTIGCAKHRLIGFYEKENLHKERGSFETLLWNDQEIGVALRTQAGINPVFVSIGHKISLSTAINWVLKMTPTYRLPETTRVADQLVNEYLKQLREIHPYKNDESKGA